MATTNKSGRLKPGSIKIDVHNFELGGDTGNAHPGGGLVCYLICVAIKTNIHVANFAITKGQAVRLVNLLSDRNSSSIVQFTSAQNEEFSFFWKQNYRLQILFINVGEIVANEMIITEESAQVLLRKLNTVLSGDTGEESIPDFKECPDCHGKKSILLLNSSVPCDCIKGK